MTVRRLHVRMNIVPSLRLNDAIQRLSEPIREVEAALEEMRAERDPLASHIFVSRRHYRNANDTKSGKRRETTAPASFSETLKRTTQAG